MRCVASLAAFAVIAAATTVVTAVTPDEGLTNDLENALRMDNFAITVKHIKPRKRQPSGIEKLLTIDFPGSKKKCVIMLDRLNKQVTYEMVEDGQSLFEHFVVESLDTSSPIKSLILHVHQKQPDAHIELYLNCIYQGVVSTKRTLREMAEEVQTLRLQVYKERKYRTRIYTSTSISSVLEEENCPSDLADMSEMQGMQATTVTTKPRGDIPCFNSYGNELDECGLAAKIKEMNDIIKGLKAEIESHRRETNEIRQLVQEFSQCCHQPNPKSCRDLQCEPGSMCHDATSGPHCEQCAVGWTGDGRTCDIETCARHQCDPRFKCVDYPGGHRCEPCPEGYVGKGTRCYRRNPCEVVRCRLGTRCEPSNESPFYRCADCPQDYTSDGRTCYPDLCKRNPCYPGVQCTSDRSSYRCGACPRGYTGDGQTCIPENPCESHHCPEGTRCVHNRGSPRCERWNHCDSNPCFTGVQCSPRLSYPFYQCADCPEGYTGNGITCHDVNECTLADPCFEKDYCENLVGSYRCRACKAGYTGNSVIGRGIEFASRNKQICTDINECEDGNNGGCGSSNCINTMGSRVCNRCNDRGDCPKRCPDSVSSCDNFDDCASAGHNRFTCMCDDGYAGDGNTCGTDSDLDGYPDKDLNCRDPHCRADNCPYISNSGQLDTDKDGFGDVCDDDRDDDGVLNEADNCPLHYNPGQENNDGDKNDRIGNVCDNCPHDYNPDQADTDGDGTGDVCDDDMDDDGIPNANDNCMRKVNTDQIDSDDDGIGDACDNCPFRKNFNQRDQDGDNVGDACDNDSDTDKDGIQDDLDNCPTIPNAEQTDQDHDELGDACDDDIDDDGIFNGDDNCVYIPNPGQEDRNNNGKGDVCEKDWDGDKRLNEWDNCPNNSLIWNTDFRQYQTVVLDPIGEAQDDPEWVIFNDGAEILQTKNSDPGIAVGYDKFNGVDFEGTFFINTNVDNDYVGFIFSYQSNKKFYAVMWKKIRQTYWKEIPFSATAEAGIQIKLIDSTTGPGQFLRNSMWHSGNTTNQVKLLWQDPRNIGWDENTAYRWLLIHRPDIGLIRLRIHKDKEVFADSGNIFDSTLHGGRLGVYVFSQEMVIFSNLVYRCNEHVPKIVYDELPRHLQQKVHIDTSKIFIAADTAPTNG